MEAAFLEITVLQTGSVGWSDITQAFQIFLNNIHWVVIGTLVGMTLGMIPGMGGIVILSILIPFTLGMDQYAAFALLTGAFGACTFAGSITAILISTPGTVSNAATLLDGYPMSQDGQSNRAIGASALSSATGALLAVILFILLIPVLMRIALAFGPREQFWLVVWALVLIPLLIGDRPLLGLGVGMIGGLIALIGRSPQTGRQRFTFDSIYLLEGLELLAVLVGLFAFAELMKLAAEGRIYIQEDSGGNGGLVRGSKLEGIRDVLAHKFLWFRCALIGFFIGALPGIGGAGSTFISYAHAVQSSKNPEEFGKGRVEGVIASESANDAKDGGQLIPTLGLGIPGSGSMAVFLGALLVHGIVPSPLIIQNNLHLVLVISFALITTNILTSVIGLLATNWITKLLEVPLPRLLPFITILTAASIFIVRNSIFDVFIGIVFGFFGLLLIYLNISRVPFLIAFILVDVLERNFQIAHQYAGGDYVETLFGSGLSIALFLILVVSIIAAVAPITKLKQSIA
ncbi:tripartite tricarboxylate transporter permease [Natrialbaceae archaeon A-CW1-1]